MVDLRVLPRVLGFVGGVFSAGSVMAMSLEDQIAAALAVCAPFAEADGLPERAGAMAGDDLQQAWSDRYAAPPDPNLRQLEGLPLAVMTQGVTGCWVFGQHNGHSSVIEAAQALAASTSRIRVADTYDYGVSMDGLNAEMGITLRSTGGQLGRIEAVIGTYGPADNGYFEVNVSAP